MAQVKIYGLKEQLNPIKAKLSQMVHECVVEVLALPPDKKFHRFFALDAEDFLFPENRSPRYTIVEISLFEGRSVETRKQLIRLLFARAEQELNLAPTDLEITLTETPRCNWGIRGLPGDEIGLNYKVEV